MMRAFATGADENGGGAVARVAAAQQAVIGAAGMRVADAGPAAIAITPHRDFAAAGLKEKNGRLLRMERVETGEARISPIATLLQKPSPD